MITFKTESITEASLLTGHSRNTETSLQPLTIDETGINFDELVENSENLQPTTTTTKLKNLNNPNCKERLKNTIEYIHAKLFAKMPRRWIFFLTCVALFLLITRFLCESFGQPTLSRIFTLLFIEIAMLMVSTFLYNRIISIVPKRKFNDLYMKSIRTVLCIFTITWVVLAHSCWIWFYVPLPGDFFFATLCFLAIGAYIHCAVVLFTFFFIERISHLVIPRFESTLLKSESLHTITAVLFALLLSGHGFTVTSSKPILRPVNVYIKDLPKELDGFSIALMTDIHIGPTVGRSRMEETVQVVNQAQPDVVAISGDLVDGYITYLKPRTEPLASIRSTFGTFFSTGNHEYMHENVNHWIKYLQNELNVTALRNRAVILEKKGQKLCLAGVDDIYTEKIHVTGHKMDAEKALNDCPDNTTTIMLVHQPNGAGKVLNDIGISKKRVDLILSGHTHAGQMFVIWPLSFVSNKFFYGLYSHPTTGTQIYVSSGVNYWGPPIKMPNLCEVVNIRLHRSHSDSDDTKVKIEKPIA